MSARQVGGLLRQRWLESEEGSVVEAAIAIPAAMLVILMSVQACLWAHASTLVQAAASRGDQAAYVAGGTLDAGVKKARAVLAETAHAVVVDPTVQASVLPGDIIQLQVTGTAESIVPWLRLPVSAVSIGSKQEFRVAG